MDEREALCKALDDIDQSLNRVRREDEERKALLAVIFKRALYLCETQRYEELLALLKQMAEGYAEMTKGH